jgi:hypothetical protein
MRLFTLTIGIVLLAALEFAIMMYGIGQREQEGDAELLMESNP